LPVGVRQRLADDVDTDLQAFFNGTVRNRLA
jgi:hypothetical protein